MFLRRSAVTPNWVASCYDAERFSLRTCRPDPRLTGSRLSESSRAMMAYFGEYGYSGVILTRADHAIKCQPWHSCNNTGWKNDQQLAGSHGHGFQLPEAAGVGQSRHGGQQPSAGV